MKRAKAMVEVIDWKRTPYGEKGDGPALVRVAFVHAFSGDIAGEGQLTYLMAIGAGGAAKFCGHERVVGALDGREGSFVLQHAGHFADGMASVSWHVVPDSGTGALAGLSGQGGFTAPHGTKFDVVLDYEIG
jgi:hypothetical protein